MWELLGATMARVSTVHQEQNQSCCESSRVSRLTAGTDSWQHAGTIGECTLICGEHQPPDIGTCAHESYSTLPLSRERKDTDRLEEERILCVGRMHHLWLSEGGIANNAV